MEDKEQLQQAEEKIREDLKEKEKNESKETKDSDGSEQNGNSNDNNGANERKNNESSNPSDKIREKLKNRYGVRKYRIQEVIKPGQVILIQILKEERGQKGAALTTFISLAGKYIVLMQIQQREEAYLEKFLIMKRNKVREILKDIEVPKSMGLL